MRRRRFMGLAGSAALVWPVAAHAQNLAKPRRIAIVHSGLPVEKLTEAGGTTWVRPFYAELRKLGLVEGPDLVIERFSAEGHSERYASVAAEVVSRRPELIVANHNFLLKAVMAATRTIPIVGVTSDPVATGLISNIARPGGNLTGVSVEAGVELNAKRLQILNLAVPAAHRVAHLLSSRAEEKRLGLRLIGKIIPNVTDERLRALFAEMAAEKIDAVLVSTSGIFLAQRALIVELAAKHRLPVMYPFRDYVELGGLIAYSPSFDELAKRMAVDVQQILSGVRAGDIPYYLPTKFELVVNVKTAGSLGLALAPGLLAQADDILE